MRVIELGREGRGHTTALVFETGDDVLAVLEAHARRTGIKAAHFTALGAVRSATLAYFDTETNEYIDIPVDEQAEVTSMVGDIGTHEGDVVIHAHCVLGRRDGSTIAGHLQAAHVRPTLELFLTAYDTELIRRTEPETGLSLIR
jgi:hypothetical protein